MKAKRVKYTSSPQTYHSLFFLKKNLSQDVVSFFFFGVGGGGGGGGEMVVSLRSQNVFGSDSTNYEDLDGKSEQALVLRI
jgi:hypothetical protein